MICVVASRFHVRLQTLANYMPSGSKQKLKLCLNAEANMFEKVSFYSEGKQPVFPVFTVSSFLLLSSWTVFMHKSVKQ